ncbi:MAG TPA: FtsL-like putative cell division protein [Saprospiraceae bacterium]|nr:FtsL-like putative cell division protein [Saprospiraceae bacterium]HMP25777.1 FtsL-like putative cell division protein [Saprospiraceae bacterium]
MAKKQGIEQIFELNFWSSELILRNLPFILFLGFLGIVYIANAHYAERNVRKIQVLQRDIKELRWYYMSLESEIMYNSKRSEMIRKVKDDNLRPLNETPRRIVVNK